MNIDKSDVVMIIGAMVVVFAVTLGIFSEYKESKFCEKKSGVYSRGLCFKKELFID